MTPSSKKHYKVAGTVIYKDDSAQYGFVGYTWAVSKKHAVSNLQYRHGVLLRDVTVEEVIKSPVYKQMSLI